MDLDTFLTRVRAEQAVDFSETLALIEAHYDYTPTPFANGKGEDRHLNQAGQNEGSCKIFAFARRHGLDESQTLTLFGEHYRHVLATPDGTDHLNIRTFSRHGWEGIEFLGEPLKPRR
ncbi:HopJ type III effector protein [Methylohalobius crimeensis]|uniref:HopJ type III effector protein n=1 Tax=Methylohalobius crimeensis TaxID=244365 RepID=UPI0003B3482E|nr:HopJ type III effector protein [Methylohalobius crimeensis]